MKKLLLLFSTFIIIQLSYCQSTFNPQSTISSVIVYEQGAMVTRDIDTKGIKMNGVIVIDSLPKRINTKTIQAKCGEGLKIVSIKSTSKLETIEDIDKKDSLNALIFQVLDSIEYQETILKSIKKEIEVIHKNDNFRYEEGTNMEQLALASELYKTRLRALNLEQLEITNLRKKYEGIKRRLEHELNSIKPKTFKNIGVEIKVEYVSSLNNTMTLSYFTPNASWYTFYDLRVSNAEKKNYLDHKAFVSQSTGEDWENVMLTLSNRNPNKRISPKSISPYILQNVKHHAYSQHTYKGINRPMNNGVLYGRVTDSSGEPLIGANVYCSKNSYGIVTDIDGVFEFPLMNCPITVSYTGYETKIINTEGLSYCEIVLNEGAILDEIVVTGAGLDRNSPRLGYAIQGVVSGASSGYKTKKAERKSIMVKPQQSLNVHTFSIEDPYSIPSNGEEYDVLLISNDIPFAYQYITYPSQEPVAYLKVGIPEWRVYDLFSGKVNLFLEGQYTGVSNLNIKQKTDTLWFSLGEDIGVHIEKEMVEEFNKKSFLKNKTIELHTFDIIVRNNKMKEVNIDIMDQVPISTDDDIKVKVLEISGAKYMEKSGFLTWKETLAPGEKKKYRISYEIKYGKNVDIVSN